MERAGFQMTARAGAGSSAGGQAGALRELPCDHRVEASPAADGATYAQHTEAGTALTRPGTASWTVEWRPPSMRRRTPALVIRKEADVRFVLSMAPAYRLLNSSSGMKRSSTSGTRFHW